MDYNCHNAAVSEFILQKVFEVTFVCTNTYRVCNATVRSTHPQCYAGIQSRSQPATSATRPHPRVVHSTQAPVSHPSDVIHAPQDLGQQCFLVTCQDT